MHPTEISARSHAECGLAYLMGPALVENKFKMNITFVFKYVIYANCNALKLYHNKCTVNTQPTRNLHSVCRLCTTTSLPQLFYDRPILKKQQKPSMKPFYDFLHEQRVSLA
jgi:hypothetical protein